MAEDDAYANSWHPAEDLLHLLCGAIVMRGGDYRLHGIESFLNGSHADERLAEPLFEERLSLGRLAACHQIYMNRMSRCAWEEDRWEWPAARAVMIGSGVMRHTVKGEAVVVLGKVDVWMRFVADDLQGQHRVHGDVHVWREGRHGDSCGGAFGMLL